DNQSLIAFAHLHFAAENVLARPHPGSMFDLKNSRLMVDRSPSSIDFIMRCARVITVNSSVGLEALMQGVPVTVLGDCSYSYITHAKSESEAVSRLAYFLFAYLVPMDLIYNVNYLRWRLQSPSDTAVVSRHLAEYLGRGTATACFDGYAASDSIKKAIGLVVDLRR
ncbi:MAG: glycosyl transferase, partial [Sterolibacteriaceae bacterium]|nr:glycosyl transferase [Candidatus Methylophosphatis haderslevensis]